MAENDFAVIVPMANEEEDFVVFTNALSEALDRLHYGKVYMVVDSASKDLTFDLCKDLAAKDKRFELVWAEDDRNVVDAYMNGYRAAAKNGHEVIIEMDAGMSHDPRALPMFLRILTEGNENNVLFERGIRTFEDTTRNTLDFNAVVLIKKRSHLTAVVDSSHVTGIHNLVIPMYRAAVATGADGLIIEVHDHPEEAFSDGPQSLMPDKFSRVYKEKKAEVIGRKD